MLAALGLLLVTAFGPLVAADEVRCWAPDGKTLADNETVVPCNKLGIQQDGVYSSCCRLDGDADQRDFCTTTGLCLSTADGVLRREYCTDKTWNSPACVNVCTDPKNGGSANDSIEMTACSDGTGTYCCGKNNLSCCGTNRAITIPTQASVVSDDNHSASSSDSFKSATIGLAVVLGLLFLAAAGVISWLLRQNKSIKKQLSEKTDAANHLPPSVVVQPYQDSYHNPSPKFNDSTAPGSSSPGHELTSHRDHRRYTELDASVIASRSELGSPVHHQFDSGPGSPRSVASVHHLHSPQLGS